MTNVRGRGLFIAFDLPDKAMRDRTLAACLENGMMGLASGANAIRFRPHLVLSKDEADEGVRKLRRAITAAQSVRTRSAPSAVSSSPAAHRAPSLGSSRSRAAARPRPPLRLLFWATLPDVSPARHGLAEDDRLHGAAQGRASPRRARAPRLEWTPVPLSRIAPELRRAVVVAEDARFWEHDGVDWEAMRGALEKNWEKGELKVGGSTITQQLAKNLYLSPARTPWRKLRELAIARRLEAPPLEEADPRAVPERDRVRAADVRRRGRRPPLPRQVRARERLARRGRDPRRRHPLAADLRPGAASRPRRAPRPADPALDVTRRMLSSREYTPEVNACPPAPPHARMRLLPALRPGRSRRRLLPQARLDRDLSQEAHDLRPRARPAPDRPRARQERPAARGRIPELDLFGPRDRGRRRAEAASSRRRPARRS